MKARIDLMHVNPGVMQAMLGLERQVRRGGLDERLLDLVRMRASQINGCAYCLDMHSKDARAGGETEQRLYGLNAWRETPYYSPRERAALEWTEALTLVATAHPSDELYERVREQLSEIGQVEKPPTMEGRFMNMIMGPPTAKAKAASAPKPAAAPAPKPAATPAANPETKVATEG